MHLQLPPYSLDLLRAVATFWRFWCGKWHERCSLFPIVPCERQRCCSTCLFGVFFNSNAGFVGIIVAALFSVPYVPERCFLVSDPYHVWDLKNSICYVSCRRSWILSSWLCVSLSPIDLSTLSSMTHHIPWMLSIGQGTRTCHTDLYLIVCPLCCFQLLLPHAY